MPYDGLLSCRMAAVRFTALGRLVAHRDGQPVDLGPAKQRLVLATLVCRAGAEVSAAFLTEAVWGSRPPASAPQNLRSYIHRLRTLLGPDLLSHKGRLGYVLHSPGADDVNRFTALVDEGQAAVADGRPADGRTRLGDALAVWTGVPYGEFADQPVLLGEVARLEELWIEALQQRVDLDLAAGLGSELLPELEMAAYKYPIREHLHAQRMLALYRTGRQAEALAAYRQVRAGLADELGIDPGHELQSLHRSILRRDPALDPQNRMALTVPAMLPPAPAHFTGREAEFAAVERFAAGADAAAAPVVAVVGPAGVGKTSFAVRWGHLAAHRFPDGRLFVTLRGSGPGAPLRPVEAIGRLLRALGVGPDRIPGDLDDAVALYRSVLAGRRVLLMLDDACSADQIRPLLPGAPGCLTVVTSRDRLTALVAEVAARRLVLDPLPRDRALDLLARLMSDDRVGTEPEAAAALAVALGDLPHALCRAAATLSDRPNLSIAGYLAVIDRTAPEKSLAS